MNQPHILIVDDEPSVRFTFKRSLSQEAYIVHTAASGPEALKLLDTSAYDLLLLDLYMRPMPGLELLNLARRRDPDLVVIILTGHSSVESAVEALRLDVFDYLFKPIPPETILERVQAGLRQRRQAIRHRRLLAQIDSLRQTLNELHSPGESGLSSAVQQRFVQSGSLIIDCHQRQATLNGSHLILTTTEFDLLLCLVKAAPEPLSPRHLVNRALGYNSDEVEARNIVKWHIHHLRRKIEPDPAQPRYIKTIRHKGYLWRAE